MPVVSKIVSKCAKDTNEGLGAPTYHVVRVIIVVIIIGILCLLAVSFRPFISLPKRV
jgi:hypothetical protein